MTFVDTLNMIFITFFMAKRQLEEQGESFREDTVPFFLHMLLNKFHSFFTIYGKLDFCWEGRKSLEWRKSIYQDYKMNREKNKSNEDFQLLISLLPEIKKLLSFYPCRNLEVERAEADDIIYQLAILPGSHTVLSTDKDLSQIVLINPDVEVYNPIYKKQLIPSQTIIEEKAIIGDKSDNIPGLHRIGKKTFEKMMESPSFYKEKMDEDNKRTYEIFRKIVDLSMIPDSIKEDILDTNNKTEYNVFNPDEIEAYFFHHKLVKQIHTWGETASNIRRAI